MDCDQSDGDGSAREMNATGSASQSTDRKWRPDNSVDTGSSYLETNDSITTDATTTLSLETLIRNSMIKAAGNESHRFLPKDKLEEIVTPDNVHRELLRANWQFLAPVFSFGEDYHLKHQVILPFTETRENPESKLAGGGANRQASQEAFDREVKALKRLSGHPHEHVVQLLATYQSKGRQYMVFPWADGNLRDFWMKNPVQPSQSAMNADAPRWLAYQCVGLARALQGIHQFEINEPNTLELSLQDRQKTYGRHGDLKPENILWFKTEDGAKDSTSNGTLKIADFGFTEFHSAQTSSNVRTSAVRGFTSTFMAPELNLEKRVSSSYDIWSFGCLLLEFTAWYLRGWRGVEEFSKKRAADSEDEVVSGMFFRKHVDAGNRLNASLKLSVLEEIDSLKRDPACSDFILDLLGLIENRLLVVRSEHRAGVRTVVEILESLKSKCDEDAAYCTARVGSTGRLGLGSSSIIELDSSDDGSFDGSSTYDYTALYGLCNRVLETISNALEATSWVHKDTSIINHLRNTLMHLEHWKSSIHWISVMADPSRSDLDPGNVISEVLESLEDYDPFLSGIIRSCLEDISETLNEIMKEENQQTDSLLSTNLRKDLDTATQCLGAQLIPLRAFAETFKDQSDINQITPQLHVIDIESPEMPSHNSVKDLISPSIGPDTDFWSIEDHLRSVQVHGQEPEQVFLPLKVLENVLTEEEIEGQLIYFREEDLDGATQPDSREYITLIRTKHLKIFAILLMLNKGKDIRKFIEVGVNDEHLPLIGSQKRGETNLTSSKAMGRPLEFIRFWKAHEVDSFLQYQRRINVPYLDFDATTGSVRHVDFAPQTILPFLECGEFQHGSYSSISKVRIHPDCHGFKGILEKIQTNELFAIKRLHSTHQDELESHFHEEVEMLKPLSRSHNHLVSLLMTWSYQDNYYLLFPCAECDLADFWNNASHAPRWETQSNNHDLDTVRWMSEQTTGLMDAIASLHFPSSLDAIPKYDPQDGRGILVISDFGSSTLNTANSRSNAQADKVSVTPTYRPPEYDLEGGTVSRAADIWSFGCVLLEFVCWGLGGGELVRTFSEERTERYITGAYSDAFFDAKIIKDEEYAITVKSQVSAFSAKLHQNIYCTQYLHDLLDIIGNDMVVVLSPGRARLSSRQLTAKFRGLHQKVISSESYCQNPCPEDRVVKSQEPVKASLNKTILVRAEKRSVPIWLPSIESSEIPGKDHRSTTDHLSITSVSMDEAMTEISGTTSPPPLDASEEPSKEIESHEAPILAMSERSTMDSVGNNLMQQYI
ncbi:hypothetical protein N0V83_000347 [Neocucurbitaria cava]|uniref:Protein kinase domain-containing protein n=1 Tax=Neocucurbitaria cava TaxID=798079 RepID=A0A9W8YJQ6_9PLEO|nr:hypothetical protein N0V83_000347 [Neocucurbitaria cava]